MSCRVSVHVCVCPHVGVRVHAVFMEGLSQRGLFYHRTVKSLNMTFQFIQVFQPPCPQEFLPGHISPKVRSLVSLLRVLSLLPLFLSPFCLSTPQAHIPPELFYAEWASCHPASFVHPYSLGHFPFVSHLVYW